MVMVGSKFVASTLCFMLDHAWNYWLMFTTSSRCYGFFTCLGVGGALRHSVCISRFFSNKNKLVISVYGCITYSKVGIAIHPMQVSN